MHLELALTKSWMCYRVLILSLLVPPLSIELIPLTYKHLNHLLGFKHQRIPQFFWKPETHRSWILHYAIKEFPSTGCNHTLNFSNSFPFTIKEHKKTYPTTFSTKIKRKCPPSSKQIVHLFALAGGLHICLASTCKFNSHMIER